MTMDPPRWPMIFNRNWTTSVSSPRPLFIREPEGNGCAERFIRLLKENLLWVRSFATIEQLRQALIEFKHIYNQQWILQRHDYKTPAQVRRDKRQTPYAEAAG